MAERKRVLVVTNKWWECDPVLFALLNNNARPTNAPAFPVVSPLGWPDPLQPPRPRQALIAPVAPNPDPRPRAIFRLENVDAEVWCISDVLEHLPDIAKYQSSSAQKKANMGRIFQGDPPALVMAVGTAGHPAPDDGGPSRNGSVAVGTGVFMHNGNPEGANPDSDWRGGPFDTLLDSALGRDMFARFLTLDGATRQAIQARLLTPPLNPAPQPDLFASHGYVAVGDVNVTDPAQYDDKDAAALDAFRCRFDPARAQSLETTHGLIRTETAAPFLFVSGITDRVGSAAQELLPRPHAQNTSAAHNAGVVIAWMLPRIDAALAGDGNGHVAAPDSRAAI